MAGFGRNLKWFLGQVALEDADRFQNGEVEVVDENNLPTSVNISLICTEAKERIEALEHALIRIT